MAPIHEALIEVGSEYHLVSYLLDHLAKYPDLEIDVLTGPVDPARRYPPNIRVFPLLPYKETLTLSDRIRLIWLTYQKARVLMKERRYDVVHHVRPFKLGVTFSLLPLLGLTKGTRFMVGPIPAPQGVQFADDWTFLLGQTTGHASWGKRAWDFLTIAWIKPAMAMVGGLSHRTLNAASVVVASSDECRVLILQRYPGRRVVPIATGVTLDLREKTSYAASKPFELLAVGFFVKRKNFMELVEIFAEVVKEQPGVLLRLVGFGPEEDRLKARVAALGLEDSIRFEGQVDHRGVAPHYHRADVFCSTSLSETDVSPSCLEAMASGLPVVVMDTPGFRPLVRNGETGWMVPQGDRKGFVEALLKFIRDEGLRAACGGAAFRQVRAGYLWPAVAEKFYRVYHEVAA